MIPMLSLLTTVAGLMKGPLSIIVDRYVSDLELRRKLKAELEQGLLDHLSKSAELQKDVILAEINSEHWLTSNWRPLLMMALMGFLILVGLVIPLIDLLVGHPIAYQPRWNDLPGGFWDFLTVGMGGYIGGRSLEKITSQIFGPVAVKSVQPRPR
jgi:hypothetical protein